MVERRLLALIHHLAFAEPVELVAGGRVGRRRSLIPVAAQRVDGVIPEDPSDHRRPLQGEALARRQRIELGLEHAAQRGWYPGLREAVLVHVPRLAVRGDHAGFEQQLHELLDIKRVALRPLHHEVTQCRRNMIGALQDLGQQLTGLAARQRRQRQSGMEAEALAPAGMAFEQRRAGSGHHEHAAVAQHGIGSVDEGQHRLVGPVQILEEQDDGRLLGEAAEIFPQVGRRPVTEALGVGPQLPHGRRVADAEPEPEPDDVRLGGDLRTVAVRLLDAFLPLARDLDRVVAVVDVEAGGQQIVQHRVRQALAGMGGPAPEPPHRLVEPV